MKKVLFILALAVTTLLFSSCERVYSCYCYGEEMEGVETEEQCETMDILLDCEWQ